MGGRFAALTLSLGGLVLLGLAGFNWLDYRLTGGPLIRAVRHGEPTQVNRLLTRGASTKTHDIYRRGPVEYAALRGDPQILGGILRAHDRESGTTLDLDRLVCMAVAGGHDDAVRILVRRAESRALRRKAASFGLALAVDREHPSTLRLLLDAGANVNQPGADGTTALEWATRTGDTASARLLRRFGAGRARE